MALYEERLANDLAKIRDQLAGLGGMVEEALQNSMQALMTGNRVLANNTVLGDQPINRKVEEINALSHGFLAVHLPTAGHLRLVASILRINNELERIGDYAVTISREAVQLSAKPPAQLAEQLEVMGGQALDALRRSTTAFNSNDADLARATMSVADKVERERDAVFFALSGEGDDAPAGMKDRFVLFVVFNMLERVSDRAQNICEETLFVVAGETQQEKTYNILFLDEENTGQSVIAEAVARKTFGTVATFSSAGARAGDGLSPELDSFMSAHGLERPVTGPKALSKDTEALADCDIVVSLKGSVSTYVDAQPFHTVFLEWDVGEVPAGVEQAEAVNQYFSMYREITVRVRDLFEVLLGEEAA